MYIFFMENQKKLGILVLVLGIAITIAGIFLSLGCSIYSGGGGMVCGYEDPVNVAVLAVGIILIIAGVYHMRKNKEEKPSQTI